MRVHIVIPDTQVKAGVPLDHLTWIGQYIVDYQPDVVVHLGDHADFPSLSSYDRNKSEFHGRRYREDLHWANVGWRMLNQPLEDYNAHARRTKKKQYRPEKHITLGNHEDRLSRAIAIDAVHLDGVISLDDLEYAKFGWTVHGFLEVVVLDGVHYSHYFYQPMTGKAYGGQNLELRLKNIGHTFTMGHQQGKLIAERHLSNGTTQRGLVVGSCYLHDEDYKGPQANHHWRGIIVKHEVRDGTYDLMEVSLDFLCRKYEQMKLATFLNEKYREFQSVLRRAS
jgi:hypothetical protein